MSSLLECFYACSLSYFTKASGSFGTRESRMQKRYSYQVIRAIDSCFVITALSKNTKRLSLTNPEFTKNIIKKHIVEKWERSQIKARWGVPCIQRSQNSFWRRIQRILQSHRKTCREIVEVSQNLDQFEFLFQHHVTCIEGSRILSFNVNVSTVINGRFSHGYCIGCCTVHSYQACRQRNQSGQFSEDNTWCWG